MRDALVRTRTRYIALAKALVCRDGLRVPTRSSAWVPTRNVELDLSPTLTTESAPLFAVFAPLNAQIAVADARIVGFVKEEPIAARLTTAHGVGPVIACAFVATIDDITRFRTAHELEATRARLGARCGQHPAVTAPLQAVRCQTGHIRRIQRSCVNYGTVGPGGTGRPVSGSICGTGRAGRRGRQ